MKRSHSTVNHSRSTSSNIFEHLEPRSLFSAPYSFSAVGIRYDDGPSVYVAHGVIDGSDDVTGTMRFATLAGQGADQPIDWSHYNRGDHGSFTFDTRDGFTPYDSQTGTRFLSDERRELGAFDGRDADGDTRDMAVLAQRYIPDGGTEILRYGFGDSFQVQMLRLTESGAVEAFSLDVFIQLPDEAADPLQYTFVYHLSTGDVTSVKHSSTFSDGVLTLDSGETIVYNGYRGNIILADLNAEDGVVGVGSGRVVINASAAPGVFRGSVVVTGPFSAARFGLPPSELGPDGTAVVNFVLALEPAFTSADPDSRSFSLYRRDDYDAGGRTPLFSGTWVVSRVEFGTTTVETLFLSDTDGEVLVLHPRGGALTFDELRLPVDGSEELFGAASVSTSVVGSYVEYLANVDQNGRPQVRIDIRPPGDSNDQTFYSVDLIDEAGGSPVVGELVSWSFSPSGHSFAGLSASGELQLWRFDYFLGWTYSNLTQQLGARPIVGDLFSTKYNTGDSIVVGYPNQFLAGFDADGALMVFREVDPSRLYPPLPWSFIDTAAEGFEGGAELPAFVGGLSGWGSSWGAGHFAGVDSAGDLWSVWWAPGQQRWNVTNLTDETGAPPLAAAPSVTRTAWDTFHIAGVDAQGNLVITWWAPELPSWRSVDMTSLLNGPTLDAASITAGFSGPLSTLNFVGMDHDGQAVDYWWTPDLGWRVNSLSDGVDPSLVPLTPWRMTSASSLRFSSDYNYAYSQSLLGRNAHGDLVRLTWISSGPDAWVFQNITETLSSPFYV